MQVHINGEKHEFDRDCVSLNELIEELSLAPQRIAVELNKQIVRRADWEETIIGDGDRIEVVHFVGGGYEEAQPSNGGANPHKLSRV